MADLQVVITGKDGVSRVFQDVSKNALQAGQSVEQAGKRGKQGMDDLGRSAEQNASRMGRMRAEATAVGAVVGTLVGAFATAGAAFRDQQRQVAGITALYGDAADEMLAFAESVQTNLGYSNDAARESMLIASSLASNYQMSAEQINAIIARSADLAATFGTSLEDAVQRVSGAIRGEGEAAERLGLNMSDAAVAARALQAGITDWNVPGALSEAEKAAFRFKLLMEDTADTVGMAEARASGGGGFFREMIFQIQDATQAVGGFLGPVGQIAAELAPVAMALPVVGAGIGNVSAAVRNSSLAMGALGLATNPVVLGFGALAAAGVVAWGMFQEGEERAKRLEDALISLGDVAMNLRLSGRDVEAGFVDQFKEASQNILDSADELLHNEDLLWSMAEAQAADSGEKVIDVYTRLAEAYALNTDEVNAFTDAQAKISAAFADTRVDHEALNTSLDALTTQYKLGQITLDEYALGVIEISQNLDRYRVETDGATAAIRSYTTAQQAAAAANVEAGEAILAQREALEGMASSLDKAAASTDLNTHRAESFAKSLEGVKDTGRAAFDEINEAIREANQATADWIESSADSGQFLDFWLDYNAALSETDAAQQQATASVRDLMQSGMAIGDTWGGNVVTLGSLRGEVGRLGEDVAAADRSFEGLIANGGELASFGDGLHRIGQEIAAWDFTNTVALAANLEDAGRALDQVLATFDRIDSLNQRAESAGGIADTLIGAPGEIGELQDLFWRMEAGLTEFTLSYDQYNAAIAAGVSIQERQLRIADDLNVIRAAQMPLLDQEMAAYEANIDALSQLPAEQQRYALALQDTAVQQQIAAQYATAYSAAVGEIPEQVATDMIVNTAEADPLIKDLLLQMGLIEEGADGTIRVNFPDGETVQQSVNDLTDAIFRLGDILDDNILNLSFTTNAGEVGKQVGDLAGNLAQMALEPVQVPVELDLSGLGAAAGGNLAGIAAGALGGITIPVEADTEPAKAMITTLADDAPTVTVPVELDLGGLGSAAGGSAADMARSALGQAGSGDTITITVNAVDNASAVFGEIRENLNKLPLSRGITLNGNDFASDVIGTVTDAANALEGIDPTVTIGTVGSEIAVSLLSGVAGAAHAIPDTVVVDVGTRGAADAASALQAVANAANSIPGNVSTTVTTNQVTNVVTNYASTGTPRAVRHGGIPGFANGGIPVELAEAGAEWLHFATGGSVPVVDRGIYTVPTGTYVEPHNAVEARTAPAGGPIPVVFNNYGTILGIDDVADSLAAALTQRRAGMGA